MENLKMYILVNQDIKLRKGKSDGQVGHAVETYSYRSIIQPLLEGETPTNLAKYLIYLEEQKKIILKCPQQKLEELEEQGYITVRDLGYTHLDPQHLNVC